MTLTDILLFCVVTTATVVTPGPTMLLALSNGSRVGVRRALPGMLGAVLSDFVLVAAVALGLGALLATSEMAFSVLKWVGAAYLAYIGIRMLRSDGGLEPQDAGAFSQGTGGQIFRKAFLVAVTNPKGYLFCSALLPQFIDPAAPQAPQYLLLALLFAGLDFVSMGGYAFIGARAIRLLKASAVRWIDRGCGAVLLALAGSLLLVRRNAAS